MRVSKFIAQRRMPATHRVTALRGQQGVIALCNIEANVVLGQYFGAEIEQSLYDNAFIDKQRLHTHNLYSFEMKFKDPRLQKYTFVVDPYIENDDEDEKNNKLLTYINDCRLDIHQTQVSESDQKYWNVDFVGVVNNGWPQMFLITTRKIRAREELQAFYGPHYGVAVKSKLMSEQRKEQKKRRVDAVLKAYEQNCDTEFILSSH